MTGLALGTKWTTIPATAAITLGILALAPRGSRLRVAGTWLVAGAATGLFTYVRNLVLVGNPLPPLQIDLGPIHLDRVTPEIEGNSSIASFITDSEAWEAAFRPGLEIWFGPLWWFIAPLCVVGIILTLVFGEGRIARLAAFVGLVALVGWLVAPQALIVQGQPLYFLSNLRYGAVALGFGLAVLPLASVARRGRSAWMVPSLFLALIVVTQVDDGLWFGVDDWRFQDPLDAGDAHAGMVVGVLVAVVGLAGIWWREHRPSRRPAPLVLIVMAGVVILAGAFGRSAYQHERFAESPYAETRLDVTDARVALEGINTQYVFYGDDLSNHVQWVGNIVDNRFTPVADCSEWVEIVNRDGYTHAVFGLGAALGGTGAYQWTKDDPAAAAIRDFEEDVDAGSLDDLARTAVFRLDGPLDPSLCER